MLVNNFYNKKLIEYLKDGQNNCIKFIHGLGDTIMFYPLFEQLKEMYPKINWVLYTTNGQEEIFGNYNCDPKNYDYVFELNFPCCEFNDKYKHFTKAEFCCIQELGIKYDISREYNLNLGNTKSPLVGVHFNSTCCPDSIGCNYNFAKVVWDKIKERGLIPIETHFIHKYHNSRNEKFSFIDNNVRNCNGNISTLIGLLSSCRGFVGVGSGPIQVAMTLYPEKVLFLKNYVPFNNLSKKYNVLTLDTNNIFDDNIFNQWIKNMEK